MKKIFAAAVMATIAMAHPAFAIDASLRASLERNVIDYKSEIRTIDQLREEISDLYPLVADLNTSDNAAVYAKRMISVYSRARELSIVPDLPRFPTTLEQHKKVSPALLDTRQLLNQKLATIYSALNN